MNHNRQQYDGLYPAPPRNPEGLEVDHQGLEVPQPYSPYSTWDLQNQQQVYAPEKKKSQTRQQRKICRLKPTIFWLVLIILFLLVAIIVGAAVAGALVAKDHASKPASTPITSTVSTTSRLPTKTSTTTTSTTTASAPTSTNSEAALLNSCTNGTTYVSSTGSTFTELCGTDLGIGESYGNNASDFIDLRIDSFHACIDVCAFNNILGLIWRDVAGSCHGVSWISQGSGQGDCWIKNGSGTPHPSEYLMSAVLLVG